MFLLFAAEAAESGLNGMFENNVINWFILVALVIWGLSKGLPPVFQSRKEQIDNEMASARKSKEEAAASLQAQKSALADAQQEADKILSEAKVAAEQMAKQIEERTKKETEAMIVKFDNMLTSERQVAMMELRSASAKAAIKLTEMHLQSHVNESVRRNLLNKFMEELDTLDPAGMKVNV